MTVWDVYYNKLKGHNDQMSPTGNAIYDPHPSPYSYKRIKTILGSTKPIKFTILNGNCTTSGCVQTKLKRFFKVYSHE